MRLLAANWAWWAVSGQPLKAKKSKKAADDMELDSASVLHCPQESLSQDCCLQEPRRMKKLKKKRRPQHLKIYKYGATYGNLFQNRKIMSLQPLLPHGHYRVTT